MLIGAAYDIGQQWLQNLTTDGRFRVSTTKTSAQELVVAAQDHNPDAILLSPSMFGGPSEVVGTIQRLQSDVYLVLPPGVAQEDMTAIREMPNVKLVYVEQFNWPELLAAILANTAAKRRFVTHSQIQRYGVLPLGSYLRACTTLWCGDVPAVQGRTTVAVWAGRNLRIKRDPHAVGQHGSPLPAALSIERTESRQKHF